MATNYKLGFLSTAITTAFLAMCSAEETTGSKAEADKPQDNTAPTIEMKVHSIFSPTYHPSLGVKTDDYERSVVSAVNDYTYVLSSDGSIKPPQNRTLETAGNSSYLEEVILYENFMKTANQLLLVNQPWKRRCIPVISSR